MSSWSLYNLSIQSAAHSDSGSPRRDKPDNGDDAEYRKQVGGLDNDRIGVDNQVFGICAHLDESVFDLQGA